MSDDIVFIKDDNDLKEYKSSISVKLQRTVHVKFICTICGDISEKTVHFLKSPFICTKCNSKLAADKRKITNREKYGCDSPLQNKEILEKIKNTCLKKYGCENVFQVQAIKDKIKETCQERYGADCYQSTEEFKEKYIKTCMDKYGTKSPLQADAIKEKLKNTCLRKYGAEAYTKTEEFKTKFKKKSLEKYGVEHPSQADCIKKKKENTCMEHYGTAYPGQSEIVREKAKQTCLEKYGYEYVTQVPEIKQKMNDNEWLKRSSRYNAFLKKHNLEILRKENDRLFFKCHACENEFNYDITYFFVLLHTLTKNDTICPKCLNKHIPGSSSKEKDLLNYIKSVYSGIIVEHNRSELNGREIDIYLPDLKLGFEFDGKYWHADPNLYSSTDIILNKMTAKEIWQRDKEKDKLCEQAGIELIRIKEYDWDNNNKNEKTRIMEIIENKLRFTEIR